MTLTICTVCKNYICPPSCPSYFGIHSELGAAVGKCYICGGNIFKGEKAFSFENDLICIECAEEFLSDELIEFFHCKNTAEFLEKLGAVSITC